MRPVRRADNLPTSCAFVTKSANLNLLEHSGPVQACNWAALPLPRLKVPVDPQKNYGLELTVLLVIPLCSNFVSIWTVAVRLQDVVFTYVFCVCLQYLHQTENFTEYCGSSPVSFSEGLIFNCHTLNRLTELRCFVVFLRTS